MIPLQIILTGDKAQLDVVSRHIAWWLKSNGIDVGFANGADVKIPMDKLDTAVLPKVTIVQPVI